MSADASQKVMVASAQACSNIALVKYWGKRDVALNLPVSGSLSIALEALSTRTRMEFNADLTQDTLALGGAAPVAAPARVSTCLDLLRAQAGVRWRARIDSVNNFPTGAGLASSASGYAALVLAAAAALGLPQDRRALSRIARQGSGSAARSIFGGFVEMTAGVRSDGEDAVARPLLEPAAWPLEVVVAITAQEAKAVGSGAGMEISRRTSPFYAAWLAAGEDDLAAARAAVLARDFAALSRVSEHSCLKMHGVMLSSEPALVYWNGATVAAIQRIRALREQQGLAVFFTVDAGPQVKAICGPGAAGAVAQALRAVAGVQAVTMSGLGEGARLLASEADA